MMRSQRTGNRYLAGLVAAVAFVFVAVGTLGPARHSPYYLLIVPVPGLIALVLGGLAWSSKDARSSAYSGAALVLLLVVLLLSHLLPRSA